MTWDHPHPTTQSTMIVLQSALKTQRIVFLPLKDRNPTELAPKGQVMSKLNRFDVV